MNRKMRRSEKAMLQEESLQVLNGAEYGVLATISDDGTPYVTPMNFVYLDDAVYFHCALEGHRIDNIEKNRNVCFNVVDSVVLMPKEFNTQYRSVTIFGDIEIVEDIDEKRKAIAAIAEKLSPDFKKEGVAYINSAFDKFHILKLTVDNMTGKATRG